MDFQQVTGFEELDKEFDQVIKFVSGVEAMELAGPDGKLDGVESRFAFAFLSIGAIDGNEGFVDTIKRGAAHVYEWIKSLIKMIRDWWRGGIQRFEQAKKNLLNINGITAKFKEITTNGLDGVTKVSENAKRISRRFDSKDRAIINEAIKEANAEKATIEVAPAIIGSIIDPIANKIAGKLDKMKGHVAEIDRLDPERKALGELGLSTTFNFITDGSVNFGDRFRQADQAKFAAEVKRVVTAADEAQKELDTATTNLSRLNEKAKGHDEMQHQLSRLSAIVRQLTAIAEDFRALVIDIDSALYRALKEESVGIVKQALTEAKKSVSEPAQNYINQLMSEL